MKVFLDSLMRRFPWTIIPLSSRFGDPISVRRNEWWSNTIKSIAVRKQRKPMAWNCMIILSIISQSFWGIWITETPWISGWSALVIAEPAGELLKIQKRRSVIKTGANLSLSYRFAPILYSSRLSTIYVDSLSWEIKWTYSTVVQPV